MSYWICDKDYHCVDCPKNYPEETCDFYIEVEEVKHATIIKKDDLLEYCSKCGSCIGTAFHNYCSFCGAKFLEEVEHELRKS